MYIHKSKGDTRNYMFCVQDSIDYGHPAAVIINYMWYQLDVKRAGGKSIKDGRYWIYDSTDKLSKLFPMFSLATLKRALKLLREEKVLICSNHNRWKNDRTLWYSMPEFTVSGIPDSGLLDEEELDENKQQLKMSQVAAQNDLQTPLSQNEPEFPLSQNELNVSSNMSKCTLSQNELNVSSNMSQPLPSINPSINPSTINTSINFDEDATAPKNMNLKKIPAKHHEDIISIMNHWSETMGIKIDPLHTSTINQERAKVIFKRLSDGYTREELLNVVTSVSRVPYAMGDNPQSTPYNSLDHIFRDKSFEMHYNRSISDRSKVKQIQQTNDRTQFDDECARMEKILNGGETIDAMPELRIN